MGDSVYLSGRLPPCPEDFNAAAYCLGADVPGDTPAFIAVDAALGVITELQYARLAHRIDPVHVTGGETGDGRDDLLVQGQHASDVARLVFYHQFLLLFDVVHDFSSCLHAVPHRVAVSCSCSSVRSSVTRAFCKYWRVRP